LNELRLYRRRSRNTVASNGSRHNGGRDDEHPEQNKQPKLAHRAVLPFRDFLPATPAGSTHYIKPDRTNRDGYLCTPRLGQPVWSARRLGSRVGVPGRGSIVSLRRCRGSGRQLIGSRPIGGTPSGWRGCFGSARSLQYGSRRWKRRRRVISFVRAKTRGSDLMRARHRLSKPLLRHATRPHSAHLTPRRNRTQGTQTHSTAMVRPAS
jgi:hypothetical protein